MKQRITLNRQTFPEESCTDLLRSKFKGFQSISAILEIRPHLILATGLMLEQRS